MILDIDEERRRISLGMKQCVPNPWEEFAQNHAKGDRVKGVVKSITDFGVFIGLDGGIDGLVHASDVAWDLDGEDALRQFQKGEEVEAVVLTIEAGRERISLGIKQMQTDPLTSYMAEHPKGSIVNGKVTSVEQRVIHVELAEGVGGYIRAADIKRERVEDARTEFKEGDEIEARFISVDRKSRVLGLSIKAKEQYEEDQAVREFGRQDDEPVGATTMGDLLKQIRGDDE